MANLYCDASHYVYSYKQASLLAPSYHWKHTGEMHVVETIFFHVSFIYYVSIFTLFQIFVDIHFKCLYRTIIWEANNIGLLMNIGLLDFYFWQLVTDN